jgi:hypothetical protein
MLFPKSLFQAHRLINLCTGAAPPEESITRWEALRRERKAPPSQWDEIRNSAAKAASSNDGGRSASTARARDRSALEGELPQSSSSMSDEVGRRNDRRADETSSPEGRDKDASRKEFEKMMERERKGGDSDRDWRGK